MAEPFALAIHPWPLPPEQLERIRLAYMSLKVPFAVQPVPANPGEPGRVLGMGAVPPFAVDVAYVQDVNDERQIRDKVRQILTQPAGDTTGLFTPTDFLNVFLGPGVTLLYEEAAPHFDPRGWK